MNLLRLFREYIAAMKAQTEALNRATAQAAWARYQDNRPAPVLRLHHHGHGHAGGNASMPGAGAD